MTYSSQNQQYESDSNLDYQTGTGRRADVATEGDRRPKYSRGSRPKVSNGMHRRRNKRWSW